MPITVRNGKVVSVLYHHHAMKKYGAMETEFYVLLISEL
jgi:hypothetical protein